MTTIGWLLLRDAFGKCPAEQPLLIYIDPQLPPSLGHSRVRFALIKYSKVSEIVSVSIHSVLVSCWTGLAWPAPPSLILVFHNKVRRMIQIDVHGVIIWWLCVVCCPLMVKAKERLISDISRVFSIYGQIIWLYLFSNTLAVSVK